MASRNVLQEIAVSSLQSCELYEPEKKINTFLPQTKRTSFTTHKESKENVTPTDYLIKEKLMCEKIETELSKESEENVRSGLCDQVTGLNDYSLTSLEDNQGSSLKSEPLPQIEETASALESTNGHFSTPRRRAEEIDVLEDPTHTPMDFSTVTVADLGISSESFTNRCAGKSPKSLMKHRRRSTIGVRGSPEMNFLIRQIALQRSQRKVEPDLLASPFVSPRNSVLKSKMSAFRNAFQAVDENGGNIPFPVLSDKKESQCNRNQETFEPPEKRKKVYHNLIPAQTEEHVKESFTASTCETVPESYCSLSSVSLPIVPEAPLSTHDNAPSKKRSAKCFKRKVMFTGLLSPEPPSQDPEEEEPLITFPCPQSFLRPVLKKTPKRAVPSLVEFEHNELEEQKQPQSSTEGKSSGHDDDVNVGMRRLECVGDSMKKKKVTFGRALSPEVFDRTLPANTPLRRGSTPYNYHSSVSGTPGAENTHAQGPFKPLAQPDFDNAEITLQPMSLCFEEELFSCNATMSASLPGHMDEMPLDEEPKYIAEETKSVTPSWQDEVVISPALEESSTEMCPQDVQTPDDEAISSAESDSLPKGRMTRSTINRKSCSSENNVSSNVSHTEDQVKTPVKVEPKIIAKKALGRKLVVAKKAQVKTTRGKGKKTRGRPKKSVQKPVDEVRGTVSKKPLLSPIPELPEGCRTPTFCPSGTTLTPTSKPVVKRAQKNKRVQKSHGKVIIQDSTNDSETSKLQEKETDALNVSLMQTSDSDSYLVCPGLGSLRSNQETVAVCDPTFQINSQSSEVDHSTERTSVKEQIDDPVPLSAGTIITLTEGKGGKTNSGKSRRSSKRISSSVSKLGSQAETTTTVDRSPKRVAGINVLETSPCLNECISDSLSMHETQIQCPQNTLTQTSSSSTSETMLPFTSVVDEMCGKSSRNLRRSTIYCLVPEEKPVNSATLPDVGFIEEPILTNVKHEKKVRRSMRLRRDSGVNGLTWVQEEKAKDERRKSFSAKRQSESPKRFEEDVIKDNQMDQPVHSAVQKSRRRTLCISSLRDTSYNKTKRRSNSSKKEILNIVEGKDFPSVIQNV
ncbi:cell division cycle-associated protein 2 [Pelodytes ibericus]